MIMHFSAVNMSFIIDNAALAMYLKTIKKGKNADNGREKQEE